MNLIFDLDGTLLNTLYDLKNAVNYSLEKFGFQQRTLEEIRKVVGNGLKMLIKRSLPEGTSEGTVEAVLAEMKAYYALHCHDETVPYDGIIDMLRSLKAEGHSLAIVSNKADAMVQILKRVFFDGLIDFALGESQSYARKPAPDMVFAAMDALGSNAIYIGDSEVDLLTAKNAGLPCLAVSWGFRSESDLRSAGAENIYSTVESLLAAIRAR